MINQDGIAFQLSAPLYQSSKKAWNSFKILKNNFMKSTSIVIVFLAFMSQMILAQDVITYKNGMEVKGKVAEISASEIKYRKENNPDGPVYTISKSEIFMIRYANGNTDLFGENTSAKEVKNNSKGSKSTYDDRMKYSGPRVGFTVIGNGTTHDYIVDTLGKKSTISQFGWQLETRVFSMDNGMTGLIEWVGLAGGIEQGMFLPSLTSLFGVRFKKGHEIGMGPNLSVSGLAMVFALGTSFKSDNVNFPVNLALVTSVARKDWVYNPETGVDDYVTVHTGMRIGLTVGFNTRKN